LVRVIVIRNSWAKTNDIRVVERRSLSGKAASKTTRLARFSVKVDRYSRVMRRASAGLLATLIVVAGALAGCSAAVQPASPAAAQASVARSSARHDPLASLSFYVDPHGAAAAQVAELRASGQSADAAAMQRIAVQPTATWFTDGVDVETAVREATLQAQQAHRASLLVAYDIPGRDCGGFSSGGAATPADYRRWIASFAAGLGERVASVILEPDAIAQTLSGCVPPGGVELRYALLRYAIAVLKTHKHVSVYLDAGNPGWIKPAVRLAEPLLHSGLTRADGFSLNVANFYSTPATLAYGESISRAVGGAHFVIDTGRNGNGPEGAVRDQLDWCNPPGRALGTPPTTHTADPLADAYLWIKPPGASDGSCRPGEPRAGEWWPQYALELARDTH
jgi:endoglucanase